MEVETGLPPDAAAGRDTATGVRPGDTTLAERDAAKAAELGGSLAHDGAPARPLRPAGAVGSGGSAGGAGNEATGRADARLVTAIRELIAAETDTSTGTRSRLIRRVVKRSRSTHGPGVVPLPGKTTFYKLIDALSRRAGTRSARR